MAKDDDPLDPAEIEALLNSAGGGAASPGAAASPAAAPKGPVAPAPGPPLPARDIDSILKQRPASGAADPAALLDRAAADLAAAIAPDAPGGAEELRKAQPFAFQAFDGGERAGSGGEMGNLKDVELDLRIELGRTELLIDEVLKLREGSVVTLDKLAGDPVDVLVNGRLVARGEVLVLNDNFCVRIAEILAPALV